MFGASSSRLAVILTLCVATVACSGPGAGAGQRSISENAAVAGPTTPAVDTFASAALTGAADIVSLLQQFPDSEVEYAQPEHGGLFGIEHDQPWSGELYQEPLIQASRSWDFAPDGMDVYGPNNIRILARERVDGGIGSFIEISLNFSSSNALASYDDMTLQQLELALRSPGIVVENVQVDPSTYSSSEEPRPTYTFLSRTYESGEGYSRIDDSGLTQATDYDFNEASVRIKEAVGQISSSWLSYYSTADAGLAASNNDEQGPSGEDFLAMGICTTRCDVTGLIEFDHPSWGPASIYSLLHEQVEGVGPGEAHLVVLDDRREVVWRYENSEFMELAPATLSIDSVGHLFFDFNPGRLNSVIVLAPRLEGFEDFGTLPPPGEYRTRFYGATVVDDERDGQNEILLDVDGCTPSCESTNTPAETHRWNGREYELTST